MSTATGQDQPTVITLIIQTNDPTAAREVYQYANDLNCLAVAIRDAEVVDLDEDA